MTTYALLNIADGSTIEGGSRSEIVDQLIPEHGALPEGDESIQARFDLRHDYLAGVAQSAQATILAALTQEHPDAVAAFDDDVRMVLFHDRYTERVDLASWESDIPLFLVATAYEPYTEWPRPDGGSVVFLDPKDETTFLDALVAAGGAELYQMVDEG